MALERSFMGSFPAKTPFYFFFCRLSVAFSGQQDFSVIEDWWGGSDWELFKKAGSVERADIFCKKHIDDLNYKWAHDGPIFDRGDGQGRIM